MSNEITIRLKCSIEEISKILEDKNFKKISEYILDDTYYIPKEININVLSIREILSRAILLRNIDENIASIKKKKTIKVTVKKKKFAQNGDIISQEKADCEIMNKKEGEKFIEAIGYRKLMNIKENGAIFKNGEFEIQVKDILNGDKLIEVELIENSERFNTIDKLKQEINKLDIPIDITNYFVKKAEIELAKIIKPTEI